jgi:hypothetical protein
MSMHNEPSKKPENPRQTPWNKGKPIGSKPPLRTTDVWSIGAKLQVEKRTRDLAMFNLAIDSNLRGCDVVSLEVEDVAPHGITVDRATVRRSSNLMISTWSKCISALPEGEANSGWLRVACSSAWFTCCTTSRP